MIQGPCHHRAAIGGLLAAIALLMCAATPALADVDGKDVKAALQRGVRYLKRVQRADGRWAERSYAGGETALVTLALLSAGESSGAPSISSALNAIRGSSNQHTYVVSLKAMALAQADPLRYRAEIAAAAEWLIEAQNRNGMWGYTIEHGRYDHSNSQFALLGLRSAAEAGIDVPQVVWTRARSRVFASQNNDGGWSYRDSGGSYGSMTAANVSNLNILGSTVAMPLERSFEGGAAPRCGKYQGNRSLISGLNWLAAHFRADVNPQREHSYVHYWLYAVERAGILSGRRYFGAHDWYRAGAEYLVRTQNIDGSWGPGGLSGRSAPLVETAFGVLFLAKGHKPLLVQKLQWSPNTDWDLDRHDVEHLIDFIGDKLGEPTAWQTVTFDAPLEDWLAAPLLYVQGHEFPEWNQAQRDKTRGFVEKGGTIFFEACCGREEFTAGFAEFARLAFPQQPLRELDAGHPVYSAFFDLPPRALSGIDVGCRTSVLFSPHDLSCLWEQAEVEVLSERAFKLGTNIAAFATGRQALRDRLDIVTLPSSDSTVQQLPPRDALRLAQVVYDGDWRPDAAALVHFAEFLRDNAKLDVVSEYQPVRLTDEHLHQSPILYMTGHYAFEFDEAERNALAGHLRRGGFLLTDACCGRQAFDESLRRLIEQMFPSQQLTRLDRDHPIFGGRPGFVLRAVGYKDAVQTEHPDLDEPELWGMTLDGRLAIVHSPFALGCGLDGHTCYNCRGLIDEDARKLAANVILYALTH